MFFTTLKMERLKKLGHDTLLLHIELKTSLKDLLNGPALIEDLLPNKGKHSFSRTFLLEE